MNRRTRVLFIPHFWPAFPGSGSPTRAYCLAMELSREFEITFLLPELGPASNAALLPALAQIGKVKTYPLERAWRPLEWRARRLVDTFRRSSIGSVLFRRVEMLEAVSPIVYGLRRALDAIDWRDFDVLHVMYPQLAPLFPSSSTIPKCIDLCDDPTLVFRRQMSQQPSPMKRLVMRQAIGQLEKVVADAINSFDVSFVSSELERRRIAGYAGPFRTALVANGVDPEYFANHSDTRPAGNKMVFSGHMGYGPNVEAVEFFAANILPIVRCEVQDAVLVVVGKEPSPKVEDVARRHVSGVNLIGEVPDVRPYLLDAAVSVVPLLNGSGTRLKIVEAMSAGRPVVSTTVGSEGLAVQPGQNILIGDSPHEFAQKLVTVLTDRDYWFRLAVNGRTLAESNYSWRTVARPMADSWRRLALGQLDLTTRPL